MSVFQIWAGSTVNIERILSIGYYIFFKKIYGLALRNTAIIYFRNIILKTMKGLDTVESLSAEASASVGLTKTRSFSYKCQ